MMNEHQKHTEFLRQCILYDESPRRQELAEGIREIHRQMHCVRRALWLMAILTALVVAGLGYGVILVDRFPYNMSQFIINLVCSFLLGSLISILGFIGLEMVYRNKLNQQREECRQLVTKLMESRLGKPVSAPLQDNRVGEDRTVRVANEADAG